MLTMAARSAAAWRTAAPQAAFRLSMPMSDWLDSVQHFPPPEPRAGAWGEGRYVIPPRREPGRLVQSKDPIGDLHYSIDEDHVRPRINIDHLETHPNYHKRDVARTLMHRLHGDYPDHEIDPGVMTDMGQAFHDRMLEQHPEAADVVRQAFRLTAAFDREAAVTQAAAEVWDPGSQTYLSLAPVKDFGEWMGREYPEHEFGQMDPATQKHTVDRWWSYQRALRNPEQASRYWKPSRGLELPPTMAARATNAWRLSGRFASTVDDEYAHLPRDDRGRVKLWRGAGEGSGHETFVPAPDPTGATGNDFHFRPPASWDEAEANLTEQNGHPGYGNYWGTEGEAKFYAGEANNNQPHGAMAVSAWFPREAIGDTARWQDGVGIHPGAQGEIGEAHVYHKGHGWIPLPDAPGKTVTATPKRFTMDHQYIGGDYMPTDVISGYMMRKEEGFGDEKTPLYETRGKPPLSRQITQQGYEKPIELHTDGQSAIVVDGHHRIDVAKQLGHSHVPVNVLWRKPTRGMPISDNRIDPWLKGWLSDMRRGRQTVGRTA